MTTGTESTMPTGAGKEFRVNCMEDKIACAGESVNVVGRAACQCTQLREAEKKSGAISVAA